MARKQRHEEHENHERWLVSYADFITLLFAFFVVMYSISSVNEGKYRVLSDSLMSAFRNPMRSLEPVQVGKLVRSPVATDAAPSLVELPSFAPPMILTKPVPPLETKSESEADAMPLDQDAPPLDAKESAKLLSIADDIKQALAPLIDQKIIEVRQQKWWLEIEIKTSILFASGSAQLERDAIPVLVKLADILSPFPNPVEVEGFTDNVPIKTLAYPSNWELSAARAASVVHVFTRYGIRPQRLLAIGYGEFRPAAENTTPGGRAQNRRVVIVVPANNKTRRFLGSAELQAQADRSETERVAHSPSLVWEPSVSARSGLTR